MRLTYPIVGMHYRPPAKAILQILPNATPLLVRREPDNHVDPNAVMVSIASDAIPAEQHTELSLLASGYGYQLDQILAQPEWHLGYVPAKDAENLSPMLNDYDATATLSFMPDGKPAVQLTLNPKEDQHG